MMRRFNDFQYPVRSVEKEEYVPSHEREGFDESKVIKLPSIGLRAKPGSALGQRTWKKTEDGRS